MYSIYFLQVIYTMIHNDQVFRKFWKFIITEISHLEKYLDPLFSSL